MYCQKKIKEITTDRTLKSTWLAASWVFIRLPPNDPRTAGKVVPIVAPLPIATAAGKLIIPPSNAANVNMLTAPLELIIIVRINHRSPNHHRLKCLNCSIQNCPWRASTLPFIKSNHKNNNQNHTIIFATCCRFSDFRNIKLIPPTAIIGKAKADILNSPNPIRAASRGSIGDQTFAHNNNQIPLLSAKIPAPAKAKISKDSRVLLCKRLVVQNHVKIDFRPVSVYFFIIHFSLPHPKVLIAPSKIRIPNVRIPIPAKSCR